MDPIKKEMTSEEKLLNLIRKKAPEKKAEPLPQEASAFPDIDRRKMSWQRDVFNILQIGSRLLIGVCLVIAVYIVVNIGMQGIGKRTVLADNLPEVEEPSPAEGALLLPAQDFSAYPGLSSGKNIFLPAGAKREPAGNSLETKVEVQAAPSDFSQGYKVVGIVLDRDPKAIIEDVQNENTVFLSQGEEIGGAVVESIEEGRVILLYNQQRVELVP